ncbi:histamine H2 receptor-like isoform X2 [Acanthaster planci]|uniref:Histamine H2 receptor-like isoform X2 n=1 Tax=Acanthaster planci TaxID=133434 RepID=A0A8B7YWW1_ACAPL|nr:histamine H2 receptor-like isoform X2 [Acanthaster planci]
MSQADTETVFIMAVTESAATDATVIPNISDSLTWDSASTNNLTTPAPGLQPPYWDLPVVITLASVLSIVMVISIIGNSLIILTIIFFKGMRSKTNMFITNLACADLGVSVLCMPFSLATVIQGDWTFGPVLCNANAFFEALFLVASTHGLMAIALHKFSSLVLPLKRIINLRRAIAMVTFAWFIGLTCAIGPLVGLTKNVYKPGTSQCGPKYPEKLSEKIIGLYVPLVGIIIPLTCLILVYGVIFNTIRKYSRRLRSHTSMTEDKIFHQQKRITITLFIVFVAFFICWTPYFVYSTLGFSLGFQKVPTILNVAAYWSGYTNSALNPIIYAWRAKSYRKAFRKIFCCNVKGSLLSDTGTANNGEFASPALLRRSRILQGGYPGSQPGSKSSSLNSILKPSPVPRRDHGSSTNRPTAILVKDVKTNHGDIWLRGLVGVNGHTGLQGTSSDDDEDDVFLPDRALRRSQSETDKEWLERKHFEVTPRAKNHFPYRSDPGKRGLKKSLSIGLKQQEPPTQQIPNINWEPDAKARRALLGRSTIV